LIRIKLKEPETWSKNQELKGDQKQTIGEMIKEGIESIRILFTPQHKKSTIGALSVVVPALLAIWSTSTFIPVIASYLAVGKESDPTLLRELQATYIATATAMFNAGGLLGTFITIPIATHFGRRPMYLSYFIVGVVATFITFTPWIPFDGYHRLFMTFTVGISLYGIFGSFTFYLPELFPVEVRGFGSGFCYNIGRIVTAGGPFIVGILSRQVDNPLWVLQWVATMPLIGVLTVLLRIPPETKNVNSFENDASTAPLLGKQTSNK